MRLTRVWADADGISHFGEIDIPLEDGGPIGRLSAIWPATGVIFRETEASYDFDWHPAPRRQLILLMDGAIELETGDGEIRRFRGGEILLMEDTGGRGHRTRAISPGVRHSVFVTLG